MRPIDELDPFGDLGRPGSPPSSKWAAQAKAAAAQQVVPPDTIGDYSGSGSSRRRSGAIDLVNPVAHGQFVAQALRDPKKLLSDPLSMLLPHIGPML